MMKKVKEWLWENRIVTVYFVFSILIELLGVFSVEGNPLISNPFISIGLLMFICGIALNMKSNVKRFVMCSILLAIQAVADLAFAVLYDMTGQYFDYGMLNLRNDAFGILESIPMNFITFYSALFFCVFFIIFAKRTIRRKKKTEIGKKARIVYIAVCVFGFGIMGIVLYNNNSAQTDKYEKMLTNKHGSNYSAYGIIGNTVNEFAKGLIFNKTIVIPEEEIDAFIYEKESVPTEMFGISKDNNVVFILVESYEWFGCMSSDEYPNGLDLTEEEWRYLCPNLSKFYDESVVMTNFHSKEKTDISETLSILGSYPSDKYINYDYPNNVVPYSVPNILRQEYGEDISINSFHNGFKTFYNRELTHKSFGFEKLRDMYDMVDISDELVKSGKVSEPTMHNYMLDGERNLDSEMIETCKDLMFPTDKRFYTYITSITMHGIYYERDNLKEHREKLREVYTPHADDKKMEEVVMNYVTTVMEFDKALGVMMEDLEKKGLLENTTIVMFGDHNAYYQQMSNYVKNIQDYNTEMYYTDLYKVPLMIYDQNIGHKEIDKFTCTSDMAPTILDMLGIHTYSNLYYGQSVFSDDESAMYSRAYGIFVGEGIVGKSMNNILYRNSNVTDAYFTEFKEKSRELVEKIKYCDQIFYQNYFSNSEHYNRFIEKMNEIN